MAGGGIGESALLSAALEGAGTGAAIGGGMSLLTGRDPLQGALMGGLSGGLFGGAGSAFADAPVGVDAYTAETAGSQAGAVNADSLAAGGGRDSLLMRNYDQSLSNPIYGDLGSGTGASSGLPIAQGPLNVPSELGSANLNPAINPNAATNIPGGEASMAGQGAGITNTAAANAVTPATTTGPGGNGIADFLDNNKYKLAGGLGLAYLMNQDRNKYGVPAVEKYNGPLSKFNYNPLTYKPDVVMPPTNPYRAQYASGGPVEQMTNENAIGANTGFPQAYMHTSAFASPYQTPISQNVLTGSGDTKVDPYTGEQQSNGGMNQPMGQVNMASGGISSLGSYSDGGRMLKGPGDGMSDDIPAKIGGKQEARLADGEFVVPADVVSHLGNGSTDAGAKQLYSMMDKVRQARTGRKAQGRQIKPNKYMPA